MRRYFPVLSVLGRTLMLFACTMLLPLTVSHLMRDGAQSAYDEAILITFCSGLLLWAGTHRVKRELVPRDGFLLAVLMWTTLAAFATIPLLIYLPGLSFVDAYFETVSGLTTTGSTVLSGLDGLPFSINLWRAELVFLGGMGLIVLAVAVMPLLGVGGMQLYKAETPGPMKDVKLTARISETAKGLWAVYVIIAATCGLSFRLAGMDWPDAVIHTFTTMGLGGFSAHDASFGHFDSPLIEAVAIFFMLVAGVNFATHFVAFRRHSPAPYLRDAEAKGFWLVTLASCLGVALYLWLMGTYPDYPTALRYATFNTVSIATSTGFSNTDFDLWPLFAPLWMLLLSSFASSSGSTGGGIKMVRALILFRQGTREMVRLLHPRAMLPLKIGNEVVPNNIVYAVLAFFFLYTSTVCTLSLIMTATGLDVVTAFTAVVASLNNTGPGLNQVGPATTYAVLNDFQTWVCIFAMLLGRLELFTLFVLFIPAFWRK